MPNTLTDLPQRVQEFLRNHWEGKPLLLGYSGGPDSKALLYALLACGIENLHLAHVDHGWRESSRQEAEELRREAGRLRCPFHTVRIAPSEEGNKEDQARKARLQFFSSLFQETPYQALLLAHQRDDLAETVLKRILEGAHLSFLNGMAPVSMQNGMAVWRPLLSVSRDAILRFLEERGLKPILDPTNSDPAFLRARMRVEILPFLNRVFGKRIDQNLSLLSERGLELREYLDRKIEKAFESRTAGPWGCFAQTAGLERIERRHLLQKIAQSESLSIPRAVLEPLLDALERRLRRKFKLQSKEIVTDQGGVFFLNGSKIPFSFSSKGSGSGE